MQKTGKTRFGCGFLLVSAVLTCVLLAINALVVTNLVQAMMPESRVQNQRLAQAAVFLGPMLLLFVEWWICDVAVDWFRPQPARRVG